jgi:hypothetical protein
MLMVCYRAQIMALRRHRGFEIDMSFKRIHGGEFQEIEIGLFDEYQRKG